MPTTADEVLRWTTRTLLRCFRASTPVIDGPPAGPSPPPAVAFDRPLPNFCFFSAPDSGSLPAPATTRQTHG